MVSTVLVGLQHASDTLDRFLRPQPDNLTWEMENQYRDKESDQVASAFQFLLPVGELSST